MISREELNKIPLFQGISSEAAANIAEHFSLRIFLPGDYVYFRGEPGNSMFVILNGRVVVTLTNAEGSDYTIATLREGSFFGELGLLVGEPRSTHVKAITSVLAAEIDQGAYQALTLDFPDFNSRLVHLLAKRVVKTKGQWQADRVKSREIARSLVSNRVPMEEDYFPGVTKWAQDINRIIDEIASTNANVLIVGEPGTERAFVARLIVSKGKRNHLPFLTLNCSNPPPLAKETPEKRSQKDSPSVKEAAQESALCGHEPGSTPYARGWRRGYLEITDTGTLVLDHVDHLAPKVQALLLRYLQSSCFSRIGVTEERKSKVRIIATTTQDMDAMVEQGRFNKELLEALRGRVVTLIPLRERKKDIPEMAKYFLARYKCKNREQASGLSEEAMEALVGHGWSTNVAELKQVLERAVAACQGKTLEEDHIFLDIRPSQSPAKLNLLRIEEIGRFLRNRLVPGALQYVTVPFFVLLIFYTLFGPREHNLGNVIAWSLLWPFLLLSIVLSGRGWCAYCPMSAISNGFVYARKKFLPFPGVMKKYGIWVGIAAFVSIFWIEHVTEGFLNARVTGRIFLFITGGAIITALLFGKRIWCLYICPLGYMFGEFAALSLTELRGNSKVCVSQCETHACLIDNSCPMGLHPSTERTRHDCILCFTCVRKCKQKSVHLDVLLPHQRIAAIRSWEFSRSTFAVLLVGSVLASQTLRWLGEHRIFSAVNIPSAHLNDHWEYFLALSAITIGFAALTFVVSGTKKLEVWSQNFTYAGYAYLPLAFFGFFDIYFSQFIFQGGEIRRLLLEFLGISNVMNPPAILSSLGILQVLPPLLALAGGVLSLYLLRKLRGQYPLHPLPYHLHQVVISTTCLAFLIIF
jgi:DNA-binding NtrC family response regulator/NAD-dependent dihydropyrimidine dehydrogenase PreA subunit